jgi:NDP-sugar pyrophosphorylase family protein
MRRINYENRSTFVAVVAFFILLSFAGGRLLRNYSFDKSKDTFSVAGCPTFYYMLDKLEEEGVEVIRTLSTNENFQLMERGLADFSISGRGVLKDERFFPSVIIGPGYSFLSKEEFVITEKEVPFISFFTDIPTESILEDFADFSIENIKKVENIEDYLEEGVVITIPENEHKGRLVHFINEKEERVRLARVPRLYYHSDEQKKTLEMIKSIVKEN